MPHVVKLSSELVAAAREAARLAHRSTAAQIEHWAALGRSMEDHLTLRESNTLKLSVQEPVTAYATDPEVQRIGQRLASALAHSLTATGQAEARGALDTLSWPQYGTHEAYPGHVVEHSRDGRLVPGSFVDGKFVPATLPATRGKPARAAHSGKARSRR
jgi:hypothetical protein